MIYNVEKESEREKLTERERLYCRQPLSATLVYKEEIKINERSLSN